MMSIERLEVSEGHTGVTGGTLQEALDESFSLYVAELRTARVDALYLGTLHLVCALPDVCGALETTNGTSTATSYMEWADRHLVKTDTVMTAPDWYKMRCAVLHQGSSLPTDPRGRRSQYNSISFVVPGNAEPQAHRFVIKYPHGDKNITLNIAQAADEVLAGLFDWFRWLHQPQASVQRANVLSHLRTVVSPRPKTWPDLPNSGITWSSTGATPVVIVDLPRNGAG